MKAKTEPLYDKLLAFPLNETDVSYPFEKRLQNENGWYLDHTRRVLIEYRRFLFLSAVAGHAVSPPDAIDQAWHLHMIYTRSYWDDLCRDTLGFPLHHGPTKGGAAETEKFTDMYAQTLASYREWFGQEPPSAIWLSPAERFAREKNRYRRVNTGDYWIIPKLLPHSAPTVTAVAFLILAPLLLFTPMITGAKGKNDLLILAGCGILMMLLLVAVVSAARQGNRSNKTTRWRSGYSGGSSSSDAGFVFFAGGDGGSHGYGHNHSDGGHGHGDGGHSDGGSHGGDGGGHGCGSDGGSSGCGSSGCGGGGCGGGGCGS